MEPVRPPANGGPVNGGLLALLADADVGALLLRPLTVQEAGRALRGACRTALALVRAAEARTQSHACTFPVFRPMWNTAHALARLQRYRDPSFRPCLVGELESLARLVLDELVPAGVVAPRFYLDRARGGQPPTLLGCHELRVTAPERWVQRLQEWALTSAHHESLDDSKKTPALRLKYPGMYVISMLHEMRLMPSARGDFAPEVARALPASAAACLCVRVWVKEW
jgi:hypothetical protein